MDLRKHRLAGGRLWLTGFVLVYAVAVVAYEVTGEDRRKRRIARREAGQREGGR